MISASDVFDATFGCFGKAQDDFDEACQRQEAYAQKHAALMKEIREGCERERREGLAVPFGEIGQVMREVFARMQGNA